MAAALSGAIGLALTRLKIAVSVQTTVLSLDKG
jgi:hypothetical protein